MSIFHAAADFDKTRLDFLGNEIELVALLRVECHRSLMLLLVVHCLLCVCLLSAFKSTTIRLVLRRLLLIFLLLLLLS